MSDDFNEEYGGANQGYDDTAARDTEDQAQQATDSAKNFANRASQPVKNATKKVAKKAGKQAKKVGKKAAKKVGKKAAKAGKKVGKQAVKVGKKVAKKTAKVAVKVGKHVVKAAVKIGKALVQLIAKLLAALGPWGCLILAIIILLAVVFNWLLDERGSTGQLSQDPEYENPLVVAENGVRQVAALTELQALIDAYYKYMSCDSHQKIYVDEDGEAHWLQFSDQEETADFSTLIDLYNKENYFYLSSYFIKMADELLNNGEFYYPEQIIKPVYADVLPLESDPSKLYITALPLVDDGSDNAKAIIDDDDETVPYAIGESTVSTTETGEAPQRVVSEDATKAMIALSKEYKTDTVTLRDEDGNVLLDEDGNPATIEALSIAQHDEDLEADNEEDDVTGVWDYGFGSILQYEPMEKEKYITNSKVSFTIHLHKITYKTEEEETEDDEESAEADSDDEESSPSASAEPETTDECYGEVTIDVDLANDSVSSIKKKIAAYESKSEDGTYKIYVKVCPTDSELSTILKSYDHVTMKVQDEDEELAGRYFDDKTLQDAFGNAEYVMSTNTATSKYRYPLTVSVISSAATFSGNLRYEYGEEISSSELVSRTVSVSSSTPREGLSQFEDCWIDDCTDIEYGSCGDWTGVVTRAGTVYDRHPSSVPTEISAPTGFQYVEDYASHYRIYIPNYVEDDDGFIERVSRQQEGDYVADLDADGNGILTTMDFLIKLGLLRPYSGSTIYSSDTGAYSTGTLTSSDEELMEELGCTADEDGEVLLLAKVIAAEAGPNKLDQLAVASVVVNRIKSSQFPNTMIGVISAPGQYASYPDMIADRTPSEEMIESAKQVLFGQFALPSNVVFQAGFTQGSGTFLTNINGTGYNTHYYCYTGSSVSTTDIFGNPAKTETEIRAAAETLHQQDIANGISTTTSSSSSGIISDTATALVDTSEVSSDYALYAVTGFDVLNALRNMQNITDRNTDIGLSDYISGAFSSLADQIKGFFSAINNFLFGGINRGDYAIMYIRNIALSDMRDTVIQAVTFSELETYSNAADIFDPDALQFIFIGKNGWTGFGSGTNGVGGTWTPGVASTLTGFTSPTTSYYDTKKGWSEVTGYATLSVPEGTLVQAVGDGTITEVSDDSPYSVTMTATADGKNITLTYSNLSSVSVTSGKSVSKGTLIGIAGEGGLKLTLLVDGQNVNPMDYFYQPTYSTGAAFMNLLNENGYLDEDLKNQLFDALNSANPSPSGPYDKWHDPSGLNSRTVGECTWWAWGRGWQYAEQLGTWPSTIGSKGFGNGGDYYAQASSYFQVGQTPKAGSWIVWGKSGEAGHVAFVEAVTANGDVVYSESGRSIWDSGDGTGINVRTTTKSSGYSYGSSYYFIGFVYLDSPIV